MVTRAKKAKAASDSNAKPPDHDMDLALLMDEFELGLIDPHLSWLDSLGLKDPDFAAALREARERVATKL